MLAHCNNFPQEAKPVFTLSPYCCVLNDEAQISIPKSNLWFDPSEARAHDHVNHYIVDVVCYMLYENNKLSKMVVFKFRALS